jgi:hypothetical protein
MLKKELMVKDEGGKEIIIEVGLAVIGVALLIVFRKAIVDLTQTLVSNAAVNINKLFEYNTSTVNESTNH